MVDSVQLLQQSEVDTVKSCLKRLLDLTTLAGHMASRDGDGANSVDTGREPG